MKYLKKIIFLVMVVMFFSFARISLVFAATTSKPVTHSSCYCCGNSQGCTYSWKEPGETYGSNCLAVSKTKASCNGSSNSSGSGACWYCEQGSQGAVYKWTSDGKTPGGNCFVVNGMSQSACSGVPSSGTGTNGSNSGSGGTINQSEGVEGPDANLTVGDATCDGILGNSQFREYLIDFLNIIRIVGVAMVIIFSSIDFGKALIAQDNDALKKSSQTAFKRLTTAIVIFFLPIILNILLTITGLSEICI